MIHLCPATMLQTYKGETDRVSARCWGMGRGLRLSVGPWLSL